MLDLDFVRQHPEIVRAALRRRRNRQSIDEILRLAEQRRGLATRCDGLYAALKPRKEQQKKAPVERRPDLDRQVKAISADIRQLELQMADIDTRLHLAMLGLPNIPHEDVPDGGGPGDDREMRRWGRPISLHFEPRPHWEVGERLHLIDFEAGARIAGSRFVAFKGMGARLERALISFMLDVHTKEHGYSEIMPPYLVRHATMVGAGQLPKFEEQVYACPEDELYLNPSAEVPLVGLDSNAIVSPGELPLRYVAWTTAFRREAGAASHPPRGLLSLHQFNKVDLFQIVTPGDSYVFLEQMLEHAEAVLRRLELPYRVVTLCAANLPFASAKTFGLEVWMASEGRYVEVSSVSNCEAFQARRANIKYRPANSGRTEYVHTLNTSGMAVERAFAAILEAYQQADGSVAIPKVLRPYLGASLLSI